MRLWSFHPKYLDNVGLSRAINEAIGGYKALTGQQKMWQNHSQLIRFKENIHPQILLMDYISFLIKIKASRWYGQIGSYQKYDVEPVFVSKPILVTNKQLEYEWQHYLNKLQKRNSELYKELMDIVTPEKHPVFKVIKGEIEPWEKIKTI